MNPMFLVLLVVMIGVMWFMNRQQRKRQQQQQERLNTMEAGSEVVTIGGLHGVLHSVGNTTVEIDCEGVILTFEKSAIRTFNAPAAPSNTEASKDETPKNDTPESPIEEK